MKDIFLALAIAAVACLAMVSCTNQQEQKVADNTNVALVKKYKHTVTVYDYNGNEIKSWSVKNDVRQYQSTGNSIHFDTEDGKRVRINGGIIICEGM